MTFIECWIEYLAHTTDIGHEPFEPILSSNGNVRHSGLESIRLERVAETLDHCRDVLKVVPSKAVDLDAELLVVRVQLSLRLDRLAEQRPAAPAQQRQLDHLGRRARATDAALHVPSRPRLTVVEAAHVAQRIVRQAVGATPLELRLGGGLLVDAHHLALAVGEAAVAQHEVVAFVAHPVLLAALDRLRARAALPHERRVLEARRERAVQPLGEQRVLSLLAGVLAQQRYRIRAASGSIVVVVVAVIVVV